MKKLALLMALAAMVSFVSCGPAAEKKVEEAVQEVEAVAEEAVEAEGEVETEAVEAEAVEAEGEQ